MNHESQRGERLQNERIPRLLFSLAVPAICAQIVTLVYTMADRIYIGRMPGGSLAMAGIGICTPVLTIISAVTEFFGRGGSPLAAISMGKKNNAEAEKYMGNSFFMLSVLSLAATALILIFKRPVLFLFGASENTFDYADGYITIYCLGTVFVQLTVCMNYYITTQGFAKEAMLTTMFGGILNIVLDPLFIFTFNMGIRGAALATVISQFVSLLWVFAFFMGKKTILKLRMANMKPDMKILKNIAVLGAAPLFMSASEGLLNICFNNQALKYGGDTAVSSVTILFSLFQFLLLPVEGITLGSQPIISYNYGAEQFLRVRKTISLTVKVTLLITFVGASLMIIFPKFFMGIFSDDAELISMGSGMLRVYIFGCLILGANSTFQESYTSLGEGKCSFFFAFFRKIILLIPLLYLLPALLPWGIMAVVLAEPISDILTTLTNALHFRHYINKKLPQKSIPQNESVSEFIK